MWCWIINTFWYLLRMNELDKVLDRANKFLENHIFEVHYLRDAEGELTMPTNVKVQLTGFKNYISIGNNTTFTEYTLFILPTNEYSDLFLGVLRSHHGSEVKINTSEMNAYHELRWVMDKKLDNLLKYFSLPQSICTKIVNEVEPMKLNESLIKEARFDNAVRTVVKDVIALFKHQREGDFGLPEDLKPDELTYKFPDMETEFSIFLDLQLDKNVEGVDVDADYYRDEDLIYLTIISNPSHGYTNLQELTSELNEVLRHEFEHIKQMEQGYKFPKKEPTDPYKYYTQPHELEAQRAGFRRRAKGERVDFETLVRNWFAKNPHKHNLSPEKQEKVIQKIIQK